MFRTFPPGQAVLADLDRILGRPDLALGGIDVAEQRMRRRSLARISAIVAMLIAIWGVFHGKTIFNR